MASFINAIRAAWAYDAAGSLYHKKAYKDAIKKIELAKSFLGRTIDKPSLFHFYLRAAQIYFDAGEYENARSNLDHAIRSINNNDRLREMDKNYIMDYCNHFVADLAGSRDRIPYLVHGSDYDKVMVRYRTEYPINWREPDQAF